MGNQFVWQERFNIGVDVIDKEHQKLFSIINRLIIFSKQTDKIQWVCEEGIKYFKEHAMKHFIEEEYYMASINYAGFEMHRRLHDNFRKKTLPELEKELVQTAYSAEAVNHFLGVCAGWLIGHTLTEDREITKKKRSEWHNLLPEEKQTVMEQAIIQLLYNLFQLNARVISECYGGEKFGDGIYYRLVYANKQGKEWEVILIFEEKLLLNTIGDIMKNQADKVDVMLMNITRYTAQQFAGCLREQLFDTDLYEVKEENLLTYQQFEKVFRKERLQNSLLFNTGAGYFAFCVVASHLEQIGIETSIKAENAMAEIKKYLKEDTVSSKKKILIIDDSATMLQAMKELFGKDYQVAVAQSGLAGIRSIILDNPDVVLLDYEMPICDGKQVLEMIRFEKDIADIPVIFLTNRVDRESIQSVIPLKPAGYISKSLKPVEIKKSVDEYFKKLTK